MSGAVLNYIAGRWQPAVSGDTFDKVSPATGQVLFGVPRSSVDDVSCAVDAAQRAFAGWSGTPPVNRGLLLHQIVRGMQDRRADLARVVADETGKSFKDAAGEVGGATALGLFFASEGQRLYGRTTTSAAVGRRALTIRQPIGVAGLIVPANTPIANVARRYVVLSPALSVRRSPVTTSVAFWTPRKTTASRVAIGM